MSLMKLMIIPFFISLLILAIYISSCTYSINMVHTEGMASDIVDENQSAHPNIDAKVGVPL